MKKNLQNIEKLERETPFKVPDRYFDDLTLRIQTKVNSEKKSTDLWWNTTKWYSGVATSAFLLILVALWYLQPSPEPQSTSELLAEVSTEDLVEYLTYENVSIYDIAYNIDVDEVVNEMNTGYQPILEDISEEDLNKIYEEVEFNTEVL